MCVSSSCPKKLIDASQTGQPPSNGRVAVVQEPLFQCIMRVRADVSGNGSMFLSLHQSTNALVSA